MTTTRTDRLTAALAARYRIERELGAGGMATVYLAEDLRHDRKVAIKVLKPELAAVLGAERFVQEIKTTAAMSHPHILPLFDSGTADGFLFYVMPYIQGETIREKLNRETQFGVDEAVRIAREVADALDYAHRHGVIHRDIKPENILLHDGRAMVMDFGIALAVSAAAGGRMTETGLSLGTPHYMSPEQATADKELTGRSDIYSLASVLYEMLAGVPPHEGGSAQQVIMRIIADTPRPVTDLRKSVAPNVAAALSKALEKLPADRFESARAFSEALSNPGFGFETRIGAGERLSMPGSWSRLTMAMAGLAALLAVTLGGTIWQRRWALNQVQGTADSGPGVVRFALATDSIRVDAATTRPFALSPDGRTIVFRASRDSVGARLWIRPLSDPVARPIDGTEDGMNPAFSPDGEWIAFVTQNSNIKKVRTTGGSVSTITRTSSRTAALAWGNDGEVYFEQLGNREGVRRVSSTGGASEVAIPIDSASGEMSQRRPMFIPGTGTMVYASTLPNEATSLVLFRLADGVRGRLGLEGIGALGYFDGHLVYSRADGTLMAAPVDVRGMKATGPAVPLEPRVAGSATGTSVAVSTQGTLVYRASAVGGLMSLSLVDTSGSVRAVRRKFTPGGLRFSPDGKRVLIGSRGDDAITGTVPVDQDVQVFELATEVSTKLRTSGHAQYLTWALDGKSIYAPQLSGDTMSILRVPLDGTAETRIATIEATAGGAAQPMRDGKSLVYGAVLRDRSNALIRVWLDGSGKVDTLVHERRDRLNAFMSRLSPDGSAVAFQDRLTGDVYVQLLSGGGALQVSEVPVGFRRPVVWGADGRRLYYFASNGLNVIEIETSPSLRVLRRQAKSGFPLGPIYDLSPDGRTFITLDPVAAGGDVWVVVNWIDEARRAWARP